MTEAVGSVWKPSPWYPMDKLLDQVRSAVETSPDFPSDADKPVIYQETEWNRVMLLFIYGTEDLKTLEETAQEFREDLIRTGEVTQINTWGFPREQIVIEPQSVNLERYGLTLEDIRNAVQSSSLNLSAGSILTGQEEIHIRTYEKRQPSRTGGYHCQRLPFRRSPLSKGSLQRPDIPGGK